jgi:hemolysin activation/secretion protein
MSLMRTVWAFALVCVATRAPCDELSSVSAVFVRELRIEQNELIPQPVVDSSFAPYLNRLVTAAELQSLAQRLTRYLVDQGYVSSGVVLPDQEVAAGIVRLQLVAGRVSSVTVRGNGRLREAYVVGRLGDIYAAPLNMGLLAERLQLLQQDPRIAKLDADVRPGIARGAAVLHLSVDPHRPYGFSVGIDNHISPNVGEQQLVAEFHHLNLAGFGDSLQLAYRTAEGFDGGYVGYDIPVTPRNTTFGMFYETNRSRIVTEPFADLDIEGESERFGVSLRHPFIHSLRTELTIGVGLEVQAVRSYLLGEPFAFAAGSVDGESRATIATFSQEWIRRDAARVVALRSTFNAGVDALDATIGGYGDGEFLYWLGQAQWLQKLSPWDSTLGVRLQGRLANDALPGYRKYGLGGADSVRGYRENLFVRDNGALLSVEWSMPIAHWRVPGFSRDSNDGELRITPFVDYGYGRDDDDTLTKQEDIASVGIAVRWRIAANSHIELQVAKALIDRDPAALEEVLQDEGVHLSARLGW